MPRHDVLTVDVGNSSLGVGRWEGERVVVTRVADPLEAAEILVGEAVGITVSESRWEALAEAVAQRGKATLRHLEDAPVPLACESLAESTGADRLATVLGALPGPVVVVDAGTAVTVDLVDREGVFRGGFIAPGPAAAFAGLHAHAPALPLISTAALEGGRPTPGLETMGALSGGVWGLAVGGVDHLVEAAFSSLGEKEARLCVTGGWGRAWLAASRHTSVAGAKASLFSERAVDWDEALVHRGLRLWAGEQV
ncbi:MAG: type III pantothenate kinase [Planctomycetota bacterium]|jgi:pantothenate kinase type III|nr:type III pantothenate kinase [Planctomycetota bacterium]